MPNNLDIDCIAVGSALIWHPGTICWPGLGGVWGGGGGVGWGCQSWVCLLAVCGHSICKYGQIYKRINTE